MASRRNPQNTPEPVAPVALGALAESEHVVKAERIFADAPGIPRVLTSDGRVCAVQRETRADGTLGPFMLAFIRKVDGRESAQRSSLADVQAASRAYAAQGITLIESGAAEPESESPSE